MSTRKGKSPLNFLYEISKLRSHLAKQHKGAFWLGEGFFHYLSTSFFISCLISIFLWQRLFGFIDSPVYMCNVLICLSLQRVPSANHRD